MELGAAIRDRRRLRALSPPDCEARVNRFLRERATIDEKVSWAR